MPLVRFPTRGVISVNEDSNMEYALIGLESLCAAKDAKYLGWS